MKSEPDEENLNVNQISIWTKTNDASKTRSLTWFRGETRTNTLRVHRILLPWCSRCAPPAPKILLGSSDSRKPLPTVTPRLAAGNPGGRLPSTSQKPPASIRPLSSTVLVSGGRSGRCTLVPSEIDRAWRTRRARRQNNPRNEPRRRDANNPFVTRRRTPQVLLYYLGDILELCKQFTQTNTFYIFITHSTSPLCTIAFAYEAVR